MGLLVGLLRVADCSFEEVSGFLCSQHQKVASSIAC